MTTADRVLQRLLLILPVAQSDGGASVAALSEDLGLEARGLLKLFEEIDSRADYLPAGLGDQIQLRITRERVTAWTTGEFQRPVRLTPRESMALELGLRVVARRDGRLELEELSRRLIEPLRVPTAAGPDGESEPEPGATGVLTDPAVGLGLLEARSDAMTAEVYGAVEARQELTLEYRALGREPSRRRVAPLVLAHAEGRWYLLARDLSDQGVRAFRMDRILGARRMDRTFEPLDGDEPAVERFLGDGRVHDGGPEGRVEEAVVEYSSTIARWIREQQRGELEERPDGAIRVRLSISDPEWLVRHVLGYGADARVVEPDWLKGRVVDAASRLA